MTMYEKIFKAQKEAWIDYETNGGFIRWLRMKYWQYRYDTLTIGEAARTVKE